jgi:sugar phosphate isomerase/epimerase
MLDPARLSINHVTTRCWSLPDAIAGYARAGVRGIGLWPASVQAFGVANTRRALDAHGLVATSYCCGSMFVAAGGAEVAKERERNRMLIGQAAELGAKSLVCVSGSLATGEKGLQAARQRTADELAELLPFARSVGVTIGIEPIHPMKAADVSSLTTLGEANALCDALGEGLGIIVDVYHVWWDPRRDHEIQRAQGRIAGFHLSDWLPTMEENIAGRGMMGDGVIDIAAIRAAADRAGFDGFYEVELVSTVWTQRDPAEVVRICVDRYRTHC